MDKQKPAPMTLRQMHEFVKSVDPLNGKNVARYVAANFTDNGNGTMTIRSQLPYEKAKASTGHA